MNRDDILNLLAGTQQEGMFLVPEDSWKSGVLRGNRPTMRSSIVLQRNAEAINFMNKSLHSGTSTSPDSLMGVARGLKNQSFLESLISAGRSVPKGITNMVSNLSRFSNAAMPPDWLIHELYKEMTVQRKGPQL